MPRKRWSPKTITTPELLRSREKRKWQIALRRYVLEKSPCVSYAPFFGLDIESFRSWISLQFTGSVSWSNFGKAWQFEHVIPVAYFNFSLESELRLCWNFLNIRVEPLEQTSETPNWMVFSQSKSYFEFLLAETGHPLCQLFLDKISLIESSAAAPPKKQSAFLIQHKDYLQLLPTYTADDFELLNRRDSLQEALKEISFLKKF